MSVPVWVQDSIFYQIFPDRFADGHPENDPPSILPWNAKPTLTGFHGGDLKGIMDRMYYLVDLGITAIYLNPIFLSPSNHRYNAVDYFQIDPKLGTKLEFLTLLDVAHRNGMKVILDGVFNHSGRGFYAFVDILENQKNSPYVDWYHIKKFPVDAYSPGDADTYEAWWKFKSLPKLNTSNPQVEAHILKVARYWLEQGIDGWRLDVPNEINDDGFWARFRKVVKDTNPDAYLVGEIWDGDPHWIGEGHFDGLMNYPLRKLILDLVEGTITPHTFSANARQNYPIENALAMYNLLSSHDIERVFSVLAGNLSRVKLAYLLLFTLCGVPAIYYGDEIGLEGGKDPDCRRTFDWNESNWNTLLRSWIKKLINIRKGHISLSRGDMRFLETKKQDPAVICLREVDHESALIVINPGLSKCSLEIDLATTGFKNNTQVNNLLGSEIFSIIETRLTLEINPCSGMLFTTIRSRVAHEADASD